MPVESETVTRISCDNPDCPGHPDLDPANREGWLFVTHEVYGKPTASHVFGSYDCLSAASGAKPETNVLMQATQPAPEISAPEAPTTE